MEYKNLKEVLYYSEESPSYLKWKVDRLSGKDGRICKAKEGDFAGSRSKVTGYYTVFFNHKNLLAHRVVWALNFDVDYYSFGPLDHIDGKKSNNSIENLRETNHKLNARNSKIRSINKTGYTGVNYKERKGSGRSPIYVASWVDLDGKCRSKSFSISIYGEELAEFLAVEYRRHQIDLLNLMGAGYTDRHGTEN